MAERHPTSGRFVPGPAGFGQRQIRNQSPDQLPAPVTGASPTSKATGQAGNDQEVEGG